MQQMYQLLLDFESINVPQGRSKWSANVQLKKLEVKGQGRRKNLKKLPRI